jgi:hypothetical protein
LLQDALAQIATEILFKRIRLSASEGKSLLEKIAVKSGK